MATISSQSTDWLQLSNQVLSGEAIDFDTAHRMVTAPDVEVLEILSAAYRVRRQYFQNDVQLYFLMNAKSGLCPEDCSYCSQSKIATSEIPRYNLLSREKLLEGAKYAAERDSKTYCIVISARGPNEREMEAVTAIIPEIKKQYDLKICACLGLLTPEQAQQLKDCGVDRVNHNVNTSSNHYPEICSTHTYEDRIDTLNSVRNAGLELCSGGIIGMGEGTEDVVRMAFELRDLNVESIPLNFLISIDGTPLEKRSELTPRYCLKVLSMFRMVNPDREIRIAGGREVHLGSMQCMGLYAANSIFVGDYLTTQGQLPEQDVRMIEEMGFTITKNAETAAKLPVA